MKYADVIIDNKTDHTDMLYTYGSELDVAVGQKVYIPFGIGNKPREGYVFKVYDSPEREIKNLKFISAVDEEIALNAEMLETAAFMKRRYLCRTIDCVKCFVPQGKASKSGKKRVPYAEEMPKTSAPELTEEQKTAAAAVSEAIQTGRHELFLLRGVTGSGKTEVYMSAVEKALAMGRTAIVLVPEISLTDQLVERFFGRFGRERIAVLHSRLSSGERYDEWKRIRSGEAQIVIGARSAVFAPLENIGVIIMDEEHETSYKSDMAPKYDTAEVAIKRLKIHGGVLILGSATPSVVSYSRAQDGIYRLLEMKTRYNRVELPQVKTVDMRRELTEGNRSMLSRELYDGIERNLSEKRQIILFLNRRGYSTFISCRECGYVLACGECGISMTYHKEKNAGVCHYCGRELSVPKICPKCGSKYIRHFGTGTEKVEEFVSEMFPEAGVARLDMDTVRRKGSITKILNDFKKGKTDILIGTQIVAKGLDFRNVGLVGIISADVSLNIPDFRSSERTFQLVTQAAGRAGRGELRGSVIIQTYSPEHYALKYAAKQDFEGFYEEEIRMRRLMCYPPYSDLIQLVFRAEDEDAVRQTAADAYSYLTGNMPDELSKNVFEPQKSPLNKESGKYRYQMLIKAPRGTRPQIAGYVDLLKKHLLADKKRKCSMLADINPYSFM